MIWTIMHRLVRVPNHALALITLLLVLLSPYSAAIELKAELGGNTGYGELAMGRNDDGSSAYIDISASFPEGVAFFDGNYKGLYINTNGNITFKSPVSNYTPTPFPVSNRPMIAPFWGDVDTRGGGDNGNNNVYYAQMENQVVITWYKVGYYASKTNKINNFQLILTNRYDTGQGNFDVEFRYQQLQWTTGNASGGSNGLGGTPAQIGFDAGNNTNYYAHPDSRSSKILELVNTSNVGLPGVWRFEIRSGEIIEPPVSILKDVVVKLALPNDGIAVNESSFVTPPSHMSSTDNQQYIEWHFDTITVDQIADLSFDLTLLNPIPGEYRTVIYNLSLDYIDINNKPVHTELPAQSVEISESHYTATMTLNAQSYLANQEVLITALISNLGEIDANGNAIVEILDNSGRLVTTLPYEALVSLSPSDTRSVLFSWNAEQYLAGDYLAQLTVTDSLTNATTTTAQAFKILPSSAEGEFALLKSRISSDKLTYHTSDIVVLNSFTENISTNNGIEAVTVNVQVSQHQGDLLFKESYNLAGIAPQANVDRQHNLQLSGAIPGQYQAVLTTTDSAGRLLSTSTMVFDVIEDQTKIIQATTTALYPERFVSQDQQCHFTVNHQGMKKLTGLPLQLVLTNIDQQSIVSTFAFTTDIFPGETYKEEVMLSTSGLYAGDYACTLQAKTTDNWQTVASDIFTLSLPAIDVQIASNLEPNLLILADSLSGRDSQGPDIAPKHEEQTTALASLLDTHSYQIVTSIPDFEQALYSQQYNTFILLSETNTLPADIVSYLNDLNYLGHGLLASRSILVNHPQLSESLQVDIAHQTPKTIGLQQAGNRYNWAFNDQIVTFHLRGARTALDYRLELDEFPWQFENGNTCQIGDTAPAAAVAQFGLGRSLYTGFDLAAHLAAMPELANSLSPEVSLLLHHSYAVEAGEPIYLTAKVNSHFPVTGKMVITLPRQIEPADTGSFTAIGNRQWQWEYTLNGNNALRSTLVLTAPNVPLEGKIHIAFATLDVDKWLIVSEQTLPLSIIVPIGDAERVYQQLKTLSVGNPRDVYIRFALRAVELSLTISDPFLRLSTIRQAQHYLHKSPNVPQSLLQNITKQAVNLAHSIYMGEQ